MREDRLEAACSRAVSWGLLLQERKVHSGKELDKLKPEEKVPSACRNMRIFAIASLLQGGATMLIQQTAEKLLDYGFTAWPSALNQKAPNSDLSFEEQLGLLVDYEWTCRQNRRLQRLLKEAKLKINACVEDIDYQHPRGLDKTLINTLKKESGFTDYRNILLTGLQCRQNISYLCTWQYGLPPGV